jgi:glycosyltransferase involved in cell wall biosynthesis
VQASITWHGLVERARLAELYTRADALLFPSAWEGEAQGLTYMEAMAAGLLVVAFPRGGARELLDAHRVDARAAANDGEAFATTVTALLADVARQRELVTSALRTFREEVSFDRYVDALEDELRASTRSATLARAPHACLPSLSRV